MRNLARLLLWPMAVVGIGFLVWRGWSGLFLGLYEIVNLWGVKDPDFPPVLPGFANALTGFSMIAVVQLISLWTFNAEKRLLRVARGVLMFSASICFAMVAFSAIDLLRTANSVGFFIGFPQLDDEFRNGLIFMALAIVAAILSGSETGLPEEPTGTKVVETIAWVAAVGVLAWAGRSFAAVDVLLQGQAKSEIENSRVLAAITDALIGLRYWACALVIAGVSSLAGLAKK